LIRKFFIYLSISIVFSSCGRQPYQKFEKVDNKIWNYTSPQPFVVEIKDPGSYRLHVQLRYSQDYPYSNIWVGLTEKKPDNSEEKIRLNIPLFDVQGKPYGSFAGKFFDRSYPDAEVDGKDLTLSFSKAGQYTLTLQHNMRIDALAGISEIGIRLKGVQ